MGFLFTVTTLHGYAREEGLIFMVWSKLDSWSPRCTSSLNPPLMVTCLMSADSWQLAVSYCGARCEGLAPAHRGIKNHRGPGLSDAPGCGPGPSTIISELGAVFRLFYDWFLRCKLARIPSLFARQHV